MLAMALHAAGQIDEARQVYDEVCTKIARAYEFGFELERFRAEADAVFRAMGG